MALILLVEDEELLRWALKKRLAKAGHAIDEAGSLAEAADHLKRRQPDLMLLDLALPDGHGLDFFEDHQADLESTVTIIMTAVGEVEDAVRAMKLGAFDFLSKPVDTTELLKLIDRSLARRQECLTAQVARREQETRTSTDIVAHSAVFKKVLNIACQVAQSHVDTILVQGESGTGKNVVARYIHAVSQRRDKPLLEINCAALPDHLVESELFGHERGAFTDAKTSKKGTLELAATGCLVLDEISELKLEVQAKLLQFLESRVFRRVGGLREIHVETRVIALTNQDLREMVAEGRFRADLYYRLAVFPITVPPLRERHEDVLPLAWAFLRKLQPALGRRFNGLTREAENLLLGYSWPGNVRELRNVVERAMILEKGPEITPSSLILDPETGAPAPSGRTEPLAGIVPLETAERELVRRAMRATGGNQTRAAELLGITRDQLRYRLKRFPEASE
ncbi:MAG: sigma-54-dependent Fis family transcriptional regulator [Acidobacteria bacterium]|nr:sigma-54-dependent Fis family transcriptional regulator [Acidobacteriota bacterium]